MIDFTKYFYTTKHLKLIQIIYRLKRNVIKKKEFVNERCNVRKNEGEWIRYELLPSPFVGYMKFKFLNHEGYVGNWNNENEEKLWLYNLHYFDCLNSKKSLVRINLLDSLIEKWIDENPPLIGNGWEPYPQSLRIVNWIKYFLSVREVQPQQYLSSLFQQTNILEQDLEYHLLGNHLFANAKALIFAGCYFEGDRAERWLDRGLKILDKEIPEQILKDGGNFELSPMYHNLILTDMLDIYNLARIYNMPSFKSRKIQWKLIIERMLHWSKKMSHPDDNISFFNDSAIGISPNITNLIEYASLLNIQACELSPSIKALTLQGYHFDNTGYTVIEGDDIKAILDTAKVGPDYIPGHAHADTLSFELSLFRQRVFVNSGTGEYGVSEERLRQRKTAAHNTVEVDGYDSSEVWSGFRVARRAYPTDFKINTTGYDEINVRCSHDGFKRLKGKVVHTRNWTFKHNKITIKDYLLGKYSRATSHLHLHPDVLIISQGDKSITLQLMSGHIIHVSFDSSIRIEDTTWHPEFGLSIPNKKIVFELWNGESEFFIKY